MSDDQIGRLHSRKDDRPGGTHFFAAVLHAGEAGAAVHVGVEIAELTIGGVLERGAAFVARDREDGSLLFVVTVRKDAARALAGTLLELAAEGDT